MPGGGLRAHRTVARRRKRPRSAATRPTSAIGWPTACSPPSPAAAPRPPSSTRDRCASTRICRAGTRSPAASVEELFAYPTPLYLLRLDGATLEQVAHSPSAVGRAAATGCRSPAAPSLTTSPREPRRPSHPPGAERRAAASDRTTTILVVTGDYLINPDIGDQDGYTMLEPRAGRPAVRPTGRTSRTLVDRRDLKAAEPQGIAPVDRGADLPAEDEVLGWRMRRTAPSG